MSTRTDKDRYYAARWARQMMELPNFYVLDTETTGIDARAQVVQVGIVDKHGEVVFDSLVKPTIPIPREVVAIHGISNEHVAEAPDFFAVYSELCTLLAGQHLIAYNMDFDWRMLQQSAAPWGLPDLPIPDDKRHCAMKRYAAFKGDKGRYGYKWHKLTEAAHQCGVPLGNAHSALGDVRMTLGVLFKMAEKRGAGGAADEQEG